MDQKAHPVSAPVWPTARDHPAWPQEDQSPLKVEEIVQQEQPLNENFSQYQSPKYDGQPAYLPAAGDQIESGGTLYLPRNGNV